MTKLTQLELFAEKIRKEKEKGIFDGKINECDFFLHLLSLTIRRFGNRIKCRNQGLCAILEDLIVTDIILNKIATTFDIKTDPTPEAFRLLRLIRYHLSLIKHTKILWEVCYALLYRIIHPPAIYEVVHIKQYIHGHNTSEMPTTAIPKKHGVKYLP